MLESVQRNFTKRLNGLHDMSYQDRLQVCQLESLEIRRLHNDLIILYKLLHNMLDSKIAQSLIIGANCYTRGHCYKLHKMHVRLDVRKNFFVNRVVNVWNCLPENVVTANTLRIFVDRLKHVNLHNFVKGRALV